MPKDCISVNAPSPLPLVNKAELHVPVAGITGFSSVDYPGKLAAVFFTQGCPWRCTYCHNPHLQPLESEASITEEAIDSFLHSRKNMLEAIVISGGEPTLHKNLPNLAQKIKDHGYAVGLHTNGMHPRRLKEILPFCDWVGLDVKAPKQSYASLTGAAAFDQVAASAKLLITANIPHELRMTYHPDLLSETEVLETAKYFAHLGSKTFFLQIFRTQGCETTKLTPPDPKSVRSLCVKIEKLFPFFGLRGAAA